MFTVYVSVLVFQDAKIELDMQDIYFREITVKDKGRREQIRWEELWIVVPVRCLWEQSRKEGMLGRKSLRLQCIPEKNLSQEMRVPRAKIACQWCLLWAAMTHLSLFFLCGIILNHWLEATLGECGSMMNTAVNLKEWQVEEAHQLPACCRFFRRKIWLVHFHGHYRVGDTSQVPYSLRTSFAKWN